MMVFPQLTSGGNVQYPLVRADESRTVVNVLEDGTAIKFEDVSVGRVHWSLPLESLDGAERLAVETLFLASEGQLNTFTLLDPATNLLGWNEDFSNSIWTVDPLLHATGGVSDPMGGTRAWQLANSGLASQQIGQVLAAPAGFEYCFSASVRGSGSVTLVRSSGSTVASTTVSLTSSWQRVSTSGSLGIAGDSFEVAIALPAAGSAQVFGPQLEAQPAAGPYHRNQAAGGVYSKVRFDSSSLKTTAVGLDRHTNVIRLVSVE